MCSAGWSGVSQLEGLRPRLLHHTDAAKADERGDDDDDEGGGDDAGCCGRQQAAERARLPVKLPLG